MNAFQICGAALLVVVGALILKELKFASVRAVSLVGAVLILAAAATGIGDIVSAVLRFSEGTELSAYLSVLLKAVGISYIAGITADICRDAGENTLAGNVELLGRAEIVLLSLPLVEELLSLSRSLI